MKVKAVERLLKFTKDENDPGVYRYVMKPEMYSSLNQAKVIREAALRSGVSQGVMKACWDAAGEVIKAWATEGHAVALPGLGTMRFGLRSKAVEKVEDVKTGLMKSRRIIFTPSVDLKDELAATSIIITCYDRTGKEVKRVTSTSGEVEDNEDEQDNENGSSDSGNNGTQNSGSQGSGSGSEQSGSGSQNSGSEQQQNTLAKPTISGANPFTESTEVTMSGPEDAEIYYTTDGSTPSAQSTLYEGGFTLSDTTTVKAIAIKNGESSEVSTRLFSKGTGGDTGGNGDME